MRTGGASSRSSPLTVVSRTPTSIPYNSRWMGMTDLRVGMTASIRPGEWDPNDLKFYAYDVPVPGTAKFSVHSTGTRRHEHGVRAESVERLTTRWARGSRSSSSTVPGADDRARGAEGRGRPRRVGVGVPDAMWLTRVPHRHRRHGLAEDSTSRARSAARALSDRSINFVSGCAPPSTRRRSVPCPRASSRPRGDRRAWRRRLCRVLRVNPSYPERHVHYYLRERVAPRESFCAAVPWLLRSGLVN